MWILWTVLGIVLFALIVCFVLGFILWHQAIPTPKPETYLDRYAENKNEADFYQYHKKYLKWLEELPTEDVEIESYDGLKLHAYYKVAESKTNKTSENCGMRSWSCNNRSKNDTWVSPVTDWAIHVTIATPSWLSLCLH